MPVSLFYIYYCEADPWALSQWMEASCGERGLRGRIRIATEGVNGTFGGSDDDVASMERVLMERIGHAIDYKHSRGDATAFPTLMVRVVNELVTLGVPRTLAPLHRAGQHLSAEHFLAELCNRDADTVVLDVRNGYESAIGRYIRNTGGNKQGSSR